mmetsp:Transcript_21513/g.46962  ORF Transcript_21513/g.46962 Transcript_21513/m.46962 type:complete len:96 (+) Transcript_21513:842-1129(+)
MLYIPYGTVRHVLVILAKEGAAAYYVLVLEEEDRILPKEKSSALWYAYEPCCRVNGTKLHFLNRSACWIELHCKQLNNATVQSRENGLIDIHSMS